MAARGKRPQRSVLRASRNLPDARRTRRTVALPAPSVRGGKRALRSRNPPRSSTTHAMSNAPSVLVLDDGELDSVVRVLEQIGADTRRLSRQQIPATLPAPTDLLVTTLKRVNSRPNLTTPGDGPAQYAWVCLHNQDYVPVRERMRQAGVHFLIHTPLGKELDAELVRLLFVQLLYEGAERRGSIRLPVASEAGIVTDAGRQKGQLLELSGDSCRVILRHNLTEAESVTVHLTAELSPTVRGSYRGKVMRTNCVEMPDGSRGYSVVIAFQELEDDRRQRIETLLAGHALAARIKPLVELPERELVLQDDDRRRAARHVYPRRIAAFTPADTEGPSLVIGRDLSMRGMRLAPHPDLRVGSRIAVALYRGASLRPIVLEGEVLRDDGAMGVGVRFDPLSPDQARELGSMLEQLPQIRTTYAGEDEAEAVVVAKLVQS
jgi:hypothetical protein